MSPRARQKILGAGFQAEIGYVVPHVASGMHRDELTDAAGIGAKEEYEAEDAPARRFLSPRVDDVGLILADAQIAGVILPGLVAIGNVAAGTRPSWLGYGNGLVLPTVSHGSG